VGEVRHRLFLGPESLELVLGELEEVLGVAVKAERDTAKFSVVTILTNIE
jgi:hypothetical protein